MRDGIRFVVVDDDILIAKAIERVLRTYGQVEAARSVREARASMRTSVKAAYIIDITLPDGTGFDVIRQLKVREENADIVILSGNVTHECLSEAHSLGVSVLQKPVSTNDLEVFAQRAVARRTPSSTPHLLAELRRWQARWRLTPSETEILRLAGLGYPRIVICSARAVSESTIKTQVASLLRKTKYRTLDEAVIALLRTVLAHKEAS